MVCFEQFFARIPSLSAYYLFSENGSHLSVQSLSPLPRKGGTWGALLCPQCSEDLTVVLADLIRDNVLVEQVLSN
jgi:hypothetical protein